MGRKRILFIPADSLPLGISRSYWLARGLAKHHEVFVVRWVDPRFRVWSDAGYSFLDAPIALLKSLVTMIRVQDCNHETGFRIVRAPVLLNAVITRILGEPRARQMARRFNGIILRRLVHRFKPEVIFFADGFYYFPLLKNSGTTIYADIQDDFDESDERIIRAEIEYGLSCFSGCQKVYAVSPAVIERFGNLYKGVSFHWLPNGADFGTFRSVDRASCSALRGKLNLRGRFVLSYIGSAVKLQPVFVAELSARLSIEIPDAVILMVGNLPLVKAANVLSIGFVDPREIHLYFAISDVGIEPLDTSGSRFLYHAMPLKLVQYAAARKPVILTPIRWLEENYFPNIRTVPLDTKRWVSEIKRLKAFRWSNACEAVWKDYDWGQIGDALSEDIANH